MNRAGGSAVPIFIICAIALVAFVHAIKDRLAEKQGKWIGWGAGVVLVVIVMGLNYDLVFNQYNAQYRQQSWNSSEMGAVIREFSDRIGKDQSTWVVAYPHWVDTRLVAFNADQPGREIGLWPEELVSTLDVPEPKLFVLNVLDVDGLATLQNLYPQGESQLQPSEYVGKDFLVYRVGTIQ